MNRGKIFFGEKKNRQYFILRFGRVKILYGVVQWGDALRGWKGKIWEICMNIRDCAWKMIFRVCFALYVVYIK